MPYCHVPNLRQWLHHQLRVTLWLGLSLFIYISHSHAADFAKTFGVAIAGNKTAAHGTTTDVLGNIFIVGDFDAATLDVGGVVLMRAGLVDAYVAKLDPQGNTLWAQRFGGSGASTRGRAITLDIAGNLLLTGDFSSANLTTPALGRIGNQDVFAIKLDSSGNTLWAQNFGGNGALAFGTGIAADSAGKVLLSGHFAGANLSTPGLIRLGTQDAFAIKLDGSGNTLWAKNFGGSGALALGTGIAVDGTGNVLLAGYFSLASLAAPALTLIGNNDAFAIKLDSTGQTTWAKNFGGSGASAFARSIAVDALGNVLLGGDFNGGHTFVTLLNVDYPTGNIGARLSQPPLSFIGFSDAFAIKLDSSGNTTWARHFGGSAANAYGQGIAVDAMGNVLLGGYFDGNNITSSGRILFFYSGGASLSTPPLTHSGSSDAYAIKLDRNGNTVGAKNFGGGGTTVYQGQALAVAVSGDVLLVGNLGSRYVGPNVQDIHEQQTFVLKHTFPISTPTVRPKLTNISARALALTGDQIVIAGFAIQGGSKRVLIKGAGPSLAGEGVAGVLSDPKLTVFSGPNAIASNDNWTDAANAGALAATGRQPTDPREAALLLTLSEGAYTVHLSGVDHGTGVGLVSVDDLDDLAAPGRLTNISARAYAETQGDNQAIVGFVIEGGLKQVLLSGRGPLLLQYGVPGALPDPAITLYSGQTPTASNNNWGDQAFASDLQVQYERLGMNPLLASESGLFRWLDGAYTVIMHVEGGAGIGLLAVDAVLGADGLALGRVQSGLTIELLGNTVRVTDSADADPGTEVDLYVLAKTDQRYFYLTATGWHWRDGVLNTAFAPYRRYESGMTFPNSWPNGVADSNRGDLRMGVGLSRGTAPLPEAFQWFDPTTLGRVDTP